MTSKSFFVFSHLVFDHLIQNFFHFFHGSYYFVSCLFRLPGYQLFREGSNRFLYFSFDVPFYFAQDVPCHSIRCLSSLQLFQLSLIDLVNVSDLLLCFFFVVLQLVDRASGDFQLMLDPADVCLFAFHVFKTAFILFS